MSGARRCFSPRPCAKLRLVGSRHDRQQVNGYDLYFLDTPGGRAFFPFGFLGRGFLVDAVAEQEARRRLKWMPWIVGPCAMAAMEARTFLGHGSTIVVVGLLATVVAAYAPLYLFVCRLAPLCRRLTLRDSLEHAARTLSYGALYARFVLGVVFLLFGAAALFPSFGEPALGVIALLVGAFMLGTCALVVLTRSRLRRLGLRMPRLRQP